MYYFIKRNGITPLHCAISAKVEFEEVVQLLIEAGANVNVKDR